MRKIAVCLLLTMSLGICAGEIGGKNLPDTLTVDGQELMLNGLGLRKKLIFKIYAGGLYLKAKSSDGNAILDADEPMVIRMHFIRKGVTPKQLKGAWNEGFEASMGGSTASLKDEIDSFNGFFTDNTREDDIYDIVYIPGKGTELRLNDKVLGTVAGSEFKKAVFGIWLADKVADGNLSSLKEGMLGK